MPCQHLMFRFRKNYSLNYNSNNTIIMIQFLFETQLLDLKKRTVSRSKTFTDRQTTIIVFLNFLLLKTASEQKFLNIYFSEMNPKVI